MTDNIMRLAVVRKDGIIHHTDVTGWHAESVMVGLYKAAQDDQRTLSAAWFEGPATDKLQPRQYWVATL